MLTPDRIRNLKPGPELDRAIKAALFFSGPPEWDALVASGMRPESSYSQFWSGLGLVVEEMERREYDFSLNSDASASTENVWCAVFLGGNHGAGSSIYAESPWEATAKAALLALAAEKRAEE